MGHCNVNDLLQLEKTSIGMNLKDKKDFECEICILGKMTQFRNRNADSRAK